MGFRFTGRKLAMNTLYQADILSKPILNVFEENYTVKCNYQDKTIQWTKQLIEGVNNNLNYIDNLISKSSQNWDFDRITPIDKGILRIAIFELEFLKEDRGLIINEALELAKNFSTKESSSFINGILGNYVDLKCSPE